MRNKLNRNHLLGLAFIAGVCAIFSLGAAIAPPWASATNAGTSVASACVDGHWIVTMAVTSQYDGVIHVVLDDPHSPATHALQPHETFSVKEQPDAGSKSWTWRWSSPDGHLTGDAISGTVVRPAGCTPPTTAGTTTTTTCTQAIPPRTDCEATTSTSPSTTTPAPPPPTSTSLVPPAPSVAGSPTSGAPRPRPSASTSATSTTPINLPATGVDGYSVALLAGGFGLVGVALVTVTRRRKQT